MLCCKCVGVYRDLHLLTHAFPHRRSAEVVLAALLPVMAALGMALLVIFNRKMAGFSDVLALQFWVAMMATPLLVAGAVLGHFSGLQPLRIPMPDPVVVLKCAAVAVPGKTAHWLLYVATAQERKSLG